MKTGMLRARGYDSAYYHEHVAANLDYAVCGEWQRDYGKWLVESLGWHGSAVLDVGCACGAIAKGILAAGARAVTGVDLCEHMIRIGRDACRGPRLEVCDAVNLHLFRDGDFDNIHCANVAEHWRPELVPFILRELRRVAKFPATTMFLSLDTAELYERQRRDPSTEDPTHLCIQSQGWWRVQLNASGWREVDSPALRQHELWTRRPNGEPGFSANDWDYFVVSAV